MDYRAARRHWHAVILAGGRGVRFWPRSRAARPKQLLAPLGGQTLLRRTFERLRSIVPAARILVLTGRDLVPAVRRELPELPADAVVGEPEGRGTGPAVALGAALVNRSDPDAAMGVFPADHHFEDEQAYLALARRAFMAAAADRLIVLGIRPRRPETGYGYIEFPEGARAGRCDLLPVLRFREKPDRETAAAFMSTGRHFWNSGQFFWRASVLLAELREHLPATWRAVKWIADAPGGALADRLARRYSACDRASIDRGLLERSRRVSGFAAGGLGWTDLGSWEALHELLPKDPRGNHSAGEASFAAASGNYIDVPGRHVALLGVDDLVVVETPDALLICRRSASQQVGSMVARLRAEGREELL